ncbi:toxic anion resistance protein [Lachnoanaerobaculum sp. JCM 36186]|uniref:toxic anion resistance protein n=1 Tax=Lachnoanaerobaculum sanguinis TaxID=3065809 RepID=UPI00275F4B94|nr:toxic anion resistance protein [Lachnoanaerobaculum sp. JCM 36186]GMO03704.1 toxic anion resistance protein [Lachnoanaerobaculum sp. JCM 36186]
MNDNELKNNEINMDSLDDMLKEGPSLTFDIEEKAPETAVVETAKPESAPQIKLSPEEERLVEEFSSKIDISNSQAVLTYGVGSQKKIAEFSENALERVKTKDLGEIGDMLAGVVGEIRSLEIDEEDKGFFGLFKKSGNKLANMKAKYDKVEVNVNNISKALEDHQVTLMKDVLMLDKMYELNMNYHKELSMYIMAGKKRLERANNIELPELIKKADESGLPEDTQKAKDFSQMINRFEKKIHDLELTKTVSLQMAPQIRLIQNNDSMMSDKIQSTIVNTIPLWKNQMVIAIGLKHSTDAAKAQKAVSDMTNELLKKNAESLKAATIETAKESERGIIDIETLKSTNKTLISTFDEVIKIQDEGRKKRKEAEAELRNIENEMRTKLLEISNRQVSDNQ